MAMGVSRKSNTVRRGRENKRKDALILSRRLSFLLIFLLALVLIYGPGFIELARLNAEAERLLAYKERLIRENQMLNEDCQYYESDEYIEKAARQKLGMVKKGETLYVLADEIKDPSLIVEKRKGSIPEIHN